MTLQFICEAVPAAPKHGYARAVREHSCKNCEEKVLSKQSVRAYCDDCKHIRVANAHQTRSANARKRNERTCKKCSKTFWVKSLSGAARKGLTNEGQFCSRKCLGEARTEHAALRRGVQAKAKRLEVKTCPCGCVISGLAKACAECKRLRAKELYTAAAVQRRASRATPPPIPCKRCGEMFPPQLKQGKKNVFCTKDCCRAFHRGDNHRQRARRYGVTYHPVSPHAVLARDRYRCMICGAKTPKRLRGTQSPRAPEVDHRIPLAMGGSHTWDNLQCACRSCNLAKGGATAAGQTVMPFLHAA